MDAASAGSSYVLFLDDDVALHQEAAAMLVAAMEQEPGLFMCTGYPFDVPPAGARYAAGWAGLGLGCARVLHPHAHPGALHAIIRKLTFLTIPVLRCWHMAWLGLTHPLPLTHRQFTGW